MAFKVKELENVVSWVESDDRLWLAADGESIVADGDPAAASLFAVPGQWISREDAERYGLVKSRGKQGDKQRSAEGNKDVAAVDAELSRLGQKGSAPAKRAVKRKAP